MSTEITKNISIRQFRGDLVYKIVRGDEVWEFSDSDFKQLATSVYHYEVFNKYWRRTPNEWNTPEAINTLEKMYDRDLKEMNFIIETIPTLGLVAAETKKRIINLAKHEVFDIYVGRVA